jgi:quercetin dioxygenase-like cupin family protein
MKIIRRDAVSDLIEDAPTGGPGLRVNWLEGPENGDRLDVGFVNVSAGSSTPPHVHLGGQVIVVIAGSGFVETDDERVAISPGDVVICPPGELHTHGADPDASLAHLTVTTKGYTFPSPDSPES